MTAKPIEAYSAADELFRSDLGHYCVKLVRIATKKPGEVVPFRWNAAQVKLHAILERQLEARGLVRALILKARRLGISTYVGARFYRRTTLWPGYRSFILTHEDPATQTLFDMVKRMHANMPADYRHELLVANENELDFDGIDAGYRIGTAKNVKGRGRGGTLQLFHGSEVAFWPHAEGHFAGAIQSVSLVAGTEVILESTANGVGGTFYEQWGLAEAGLSDFIAVFLPWMIEPEHVRALTEDYEPSEDEREYQRLYKLSAEQLCWAHFKNIELGGQPGELCGMYKQEYPATSAEAFQTTGTDSFVPSEAILRARRWKAPDQSHMPRVLGVDIARGGNDRTRLLDRQGRKAGTIDEVMHTDDLVQVANRVAKVLVDNPDIRKAFIDITGLGAGVYDILRNNGHEDRVSGINFGSKAQDPEKYVDRRAEMHARTKEWFLDPGGAEIPDDDTAHRHVAASGFSYDMNSRLRIEKKTDIKKRLGFSPDWQDALGLTFADILPIDMPDERPKWMRDLDNADAEAGDAMTA